MKEVLVKKYEKIYYLGYGLERYKDNLGICSEILVLEVEMIRILLVINTLVTIIALAFLVIGINTLKNDECNIKGIRYILWGTNVTGICIVFNCHTFITKLDRILIDIFILK